MTLQYDIQARVIFTVAGWGEKIPFLPPTVPLCTVHIADTWWTWTWHSFVRDHQSTVLNREMDLGENNDSKSKQ